MMSDDPIQNSYPAPVAVCYGCGRHNEHGHHFQTYWNGEEGIAHFTPESHLIAFPGAVYGGTLASLIDCHSIGTAIAHTYQAQGREPDTDPMIAYVTGNLNVSFKQPTPVGVELEIRAHVKELHQRKAIVTSTIYADGVEYVHGEVIAVNVSARL